MQKLTLFLIKIGVRFIGWLPFGIVYLLSDILFFVFFFIIRYRKDIIKSNLSRSFPEKKALEIKRITRLYLRYLCDLILEIIKGLTLPKTTLQHRFVYKNPDIFDQLFRENKSAILLGSHYGNWEWGSLSFPLAVQHNVVGIYKPIKNKYLENYLNRQRKQWGLHLISMSQTTRAIIQYKSQPTLFVMIADQTPVDVKNAHWLPFLQQDTPFLHGADKLARQTGYPVFHFKIKRVQRGHYEVWFEELCPNPKHIETAGITRRYARQLEEMIIDAPPYWLWSHRRWKRGRGL